MAGGRTQTDDGFGFFARLVLGFGGNLLALWLASRWIDSVGYDSFGDLMIAAAVLAVVNAFVKPIFVLLGCFFIIITLGIALFFINMGMVALTAWIVPGFEVGGFWSVAGTTVIVWAANLLVLLVAEGLRGKNKTVS
jgi:putative membrane protein